MLHFFLKQIYIFFIQIERASLSTFSLFIHLNKNSQWYSFDFIYNPYKLGCFPYALPKGRLNGSAHSSSFKIICFQIYIFLYIIKNNNKINPTILSSTFYRLAYFILCPLLKSFLTPPPPIFLDTSTANFLMN